MSFTVWLIDRDGESRMTIETKTLVDALDQLNSLDHNTEDGWLGAYDITDNDTNTEIPLIYNGKTYRLESVDSYSSLFSHIINIVDDITDETARINAKRLKEKENA